MQLIERTYVPAPVDGTSTWRVLDKREDNCKMSGFEERGFAVVVGDTSYDVTVASDDPKLLDGTVTYHELNNTFLPRPLKKSPDSLHVVYATQGDIVTDSGEVISMGDNPYTATITTDGSQVFASGKTSVGTLKSICFGAATSLACRGTKNVPLHASIGTYDGEHAFAVSGRGNWGKTTNMIGAKIVSPKISVITDDWSILDTEQATLVPIDMLVAVRPEAIPGIMSATRCTKAPDFLTLAQKDAGKLFSVFDIFGDSEYRSHITLDRILLTDKRKIHQNSPNIYETTGLDEAWRLQDDAYHSPDIEGAYRERYAGLLPKVEVGAISTTLPDNLRALQLAAIVKFFKG